MICKLYSHRQCNHRTRTIMLDNLQHHRQGYTLATYSLSLLVELIFQMFILIVFVSQVTTISTQQTSTQQISTQQISTQQISTISTTTLFNLSMSTASQNDVTTNSSDFNSMWSNATMAQKPHEILLGYITTMTFADNSELADGKKISGAMTLAINTINEDPVILHGYKLVYILGDNFGTELKSLDILTDQWKRGAVAFFGPEDSCEVESRVAAAWKLPILAYKCSDPVVSDKTRFPTLARTQPPASHSVRSVLALMKFYNWTKFSIFVEEIELMPRAGLDLQRSAKGNNLTVNHFINISGPYSALYNYQSLHAAIDRTYEETRIYVVYSRWPMFQDFVGRFYEKGLTQSGVYVIIGILNDQPFQDSMSTELMFLQNEFSEDRDNKSAALYQGVLILVGMPITNPNFSQWEQTVIDYLYKPPINFQRLPFSDKLGIKIDVPVFATYLYDSVLIYAQALHEVFMEGGTAEQGTKVFAKITDRTFQSIQGHDVYIDQNGDAEGNYTVLALQPMNNSFGRGLRPAGRFQRNHLNRQEVTYIMDVNIFGENVPVDEPACGFHGDKCRVEPSILTYILGGCIGSAGLVLTIVANLFYRNWRYEQELASLIWKIDIRDIQLQTDTAISALSMISNNVCRSKASPIMGPEQEQRFTMVGVYKANFVAIKPVRKKVVDTSCREIKLELKLMRSLRHDNVVQFVGVTIESAQINIINEYCSKGSLEDILENTDIKLDEIFIASIVSDILKGMIYIHNCRVVSHGNLKSSNCLVDSRWVIKVGDFGLNKFKEKQEIANDGEHASYKRLLWTAPELLRMDRPPAAGTQKADIYSFGIVLYEIIERNGPYSDCHLTPQEIVALVKQGPHQLQNNPFRPCTISLTCEKYILDTMTQCWHEDPVHRPDFKTCRQALKAMQKGNHSNIFDNMMMMMEKYANNLESLVTDRTLELQEEKKKTESLLHRMLPTSVAGQLVRGQSVKPEAYDCVTIYFSDICGFTTLSSESTPLQIVNMLNDLYTLFDYVIKDYDVYKVETIGDAYMVVSGLPNKNIAHAGQIASMSLNLLAAIKQFKIAHRPNDLLKLRIGIHSGPCVAGVVGQTMPRYCLFGDTVNTASRMESHGEALKIHVSASCKLLLDDLGGYYLVKRGLVDLKGKGEILTYWLLDEDEDNQVSGARRNENNIQTDFSPMFASNGRFRTQEQIYTNDSSFMPQTGSSFSFKLQETKSNFSSASATVRSCVGAKSTTSILHYFPRDVTVLESAAHDDDVTFILGQKHQTSVIEMSDMTSTVATNNQCLQDKNDNCVSNDTNGLLPSMKMDEIQQQTTPHQQDSELLHVTYNLMPTCDSKITTDGCSCNNNRYQTERTYSTHSPSLGTRAEMPVSVQCNLDINPTTEMTFVQICCPDSLYQNDKSQLQENMKPDQEQDNATLSETEICIHNTTNSDKIESQISTVSEATVTREINRKTNKKVQVFEAFNQRLHDDVASLSAHVI